MFDGLLLVVLVLNLLWFGLAFRLFTLQPSRAAKMLVARSGRDNPLMPTLAASLRFLGGLNLALAVFAALLLAERELFPDARAWVLFAVVFAVGHASQFYGNIPVLRQGWRSGVPLWPVLSGPMLFIFVVDGSLMIANTAVAAFAYTRA